MKRPKVINLDKDFKPYGDIFVTLSHDCIKFPAGEPHFVLHDLHKVDAGDIIWVTLRFDSPEKLIILAQCIEILHSAYSGLKIAVLFPYFPGGRQDRKTSPEVPFTARVYADLLNSLNVDQYLTVHPAHSDVTAAVLRNHMFALEDFEFIKAILKKDTYDTFVCPDAGAEKYHYSLGASFKNIQTVWCRKHRDTRTGNLVDFQVLLDNEEQITDSKLLLVDDICDGGGTFIGLGEKLKALKPAKLSLAVTHGIFSKGISSLLDIFDHIYTTESFKHGQEHEKLTTFKYIDL